MQAELALKRTARAAAAEFWTASGVVPAASRTIDRRGRPPPGWRTPVGSADRPSLCRHRSQDIRGRVRMHSLGECLGSSRCSCAERRSNDHVTESIHPHNRVGRRWTSEIRVTTVGRPEMRSLVNRVGDIASDLSLWAARLRRAALCPPPPTRRRSCSQNSLCLFVDAPQAPRAVRRQDAASCEDRRGGLPLGPPGATAPPSPGSNVRRRSGRLANRSGLSTRGGTASFPRYEARHTVRLRDLRCCAATAPRSAVGRMRWSTATTGTGPSHPEHR